MEKQTQKQSQSVQTQSQFQLAPVIQLYITILFSFVVFFLSTAESVDGDKTHGVLNAGINYVVIRYAP